MWSAEGNRASNTLTGADGPYNGRIVSRQNQPSFLIHFKYGAAAQLPSLRLYRIGPSGDSCSNGVGGANAPPI